MTGEAVVLGVRTAKLPSRALAVLLDLVVEVAAFFICAVVLTVAQPNLDGAAAAAVLLSLTVFFLVALPILIETLSRGKSLGKLAFGLRVVRTDGGPVSFRHALVRGLVGFFEIIMLTGAPAAISSLVSPEGRRLGDVFAGTLVIRERVATARGAAAAIASPRRRCCTRWGPNWCGSSCRRCRPSSGSLFANYFHAQDSWTRR